MAKLSFDCQANAAAVRMERKEEVAGTELQEGL
jgi:hypothetical protein